MNDLDPVRKRGAFGTRPDRTVQARHNGRKTWRRLKGEKQLPKVVKGATFTNGVEVTNTPAQNAA